MWMRWVKDTRNTLRRQVAKGHQIQILIMSAQSAFDDHDLLTVIQADRQQCETHR